MNDVPTYSTYLANASVMTSPSLPEVPPRFTYIRTKGQLAEQRPGCARNVLGLGSYEHI